MRDGIRGSKDLRARFRKFLILTNERKQMSKTTLRKRIALTAVTAIGAGLLSVVPVSTANAANNVDPGNAGVTNPTASAKLNIASKTSLVGKITVSATDTANLSVGLVAVSDIAGGKQEGTTQTAVLLSTGTIVVYSSATATTSHFVNVTGGTIVESINSDGINSSSTTVGNTNDPDTMAVAIRPSSGSTSMVIRLYDATTTTYSSANEATALATGLAAPQLGTLTGQITVTIAATSGSGVVSPAKSNLYTVAAGANVDGATADVPTEAVQDNSEVGCVNIQLKDAYGVALTANPAALLTATATNNAVLAFDTENCAAGVSAASAFYTSTPDDVVLSVAQPVAGAPLSTTVTILYGGVVVGTKSFVIRGKVAKVTVSSPKISAADNTAGDDSATVKFEDSAGNTIYPTSSSTIYPLTTSTFGITAATAKSGYVSAATIASTTVPDAATSTTGKIAWTCGVLSTKQAISMTYTNVDGSTVVSNTFDASCGGAPASYSASFDKASYAPGEIATLSVTFKDKGGSLASDESAIATHVSAGVSDASISAPGLTMVGAPTSVDRTTNGVKKYTFTVGSTEGSFNAVANFPTIDDPATVSYTIKAGTASVSNADVLKSIVSLIASINKQIQALQKLILKR